jgi:hypothetical protein
MSTLKDSATELADAWWASLIIPGFYFQNSAIYFGCLNVLDTWWHIWTLRIFWIRCHFLVFLMNHPLLHIIIPCARIICIRLAVVDWFSYGPVCSPYHFQVPSLIVLDFEVHGIGCEYDMKIELFSSSYCIYFWKLNIVTPIFPLLLTWVFV